MKFFKRNIYFLIFFIVIFIGTMSPLVIFFLIMYQGPPMSKSAMERGFNKNKADMLLVANFLVNSGYDSIYIPDFDKSCTMSVFSEHTDVTVDDSEVAAAINRLINWRGYRVISKGENVVNFFRWGNKVNYRGVVFSIDGEIPDEASFTFLTHIEPLTEPDWYYYEEDLNEWKRNHPKQNDNLGYSKIKFLAFCEAIPNSV
jgi:hypothetical protein